jgi:hypothetical protein
MARSTKILPTTLLLLVLLPPLAGCSRPPRFDATSDATVESSIKAMAEPLSEGGRKAFASDLTTVSVPGIVKAAFGSGRGKAKGEPPKKSELFRGLHGLTVAEIHAKAEAIRVGFAGSRN